MEAQMIIRLALLPSSSLSLFLFLFLLLEKLNNIFNNMFGRYIVVTPFNTSIGTLRCCNEYFREETNKKNYSNSKEQTMK